MKKTVVATRSIPAGEFKAHCLRLLDEVNTTRTRLVITKRGRPVAELGPIGERPPSIIGSMRGTGRILGDIISPIDVAWGADERNLSGDDQPPD
ncbi:MAG: type II toxin-antitoxin system Phd/YefM family antitoxin [Alphaproteobacteria bacterium]|nr:type II toxin-antitoxin system Phd/YefM family antitoxin [Alphaproteobacteria bacterium]